MTILVAGVIAPVMTQNAFADTTGLKSPSSHSIDEFSDPANAYASDNSRARANLGDDQAYSGFSFGVPIGATIDGITVKIEAEKDSSFPRCGDFVGDPKIHVRLSDPTLVGSASGTGDFTGDIKTTTNYGTTDSIKTLGSSSDTWSNTYTATQINNLNILLTSDCGSGSTSYLDIDHVQVEVTYTPFVDIIPPVVTGSIVNIQDGGDTVQTLVDEYTESCTATDETSPANPVCTVQSGNIDTTVLGLQSVTYEATDDAGNIGTETITTTVVVTSFKPKAPLLDLVYTPLGVELTIRANNNCVDGTLTEPVSYKIMKRTSYDGGATWTSVLSPLTTIPAEDACANTSFTDGDVDVGQYVRYRTIAINLLAQESGQSNKRDITIVQETCQLNFHWDNTVELCVVNRNGGSGDDKHKTAPTFGIDWNTKSQIVEDGVTFNRNSYDVDDNFHTDFKRQGIMVGANNIVAMKVYAPYDLKWVEFIFDVPETGAANNAKASIFVPMTWMDTDEIDQVNVKIDQDVNLINVDKLEVLRMKTTCTDVDVEKVCDLIAATINFNEQPESGVFAFKAVDERNRSTTTYFNDGIEVTGDSLNPLETILVSTPDRDHRGLVTLTQVGDRYDNLWASADGYTYEVNQFGTLILVDAPAQEARVDSGEPNTRTHSAFGELKFYESERAKYVYFNADNLVSEGAPSFAYEFPTEDSRTQFLKEHDMLGFARGQ